MLVGYMRVSTDGDRQTFDLQRNALFPPGSMNVTCSRIAYLAPLTIETCLASGNAGPVWCSA
jgi:hypothetical protein